MERIELETYTVAGGFDHYHDLGMVIYWKFAARFPMRHFSTNDFVIQFSFLNFFLLDTINVFFRGNTKKLHAETEKF